MTECCLVTYLACVSAVLSLKCLALPLNVVKQKTALELKHADIARMMRQENLPKAMWIHTLSRAPAAFVQVIEPFDMNTDRWLFVESVCSTTAAAQFFVGK